jgi:hypothetical protein
MLGGAAKIPSSKTMRLTSELSVGDELLHVFVVISSHQIENFVRFDGLLELPLRGFEYRCSLDGSLDEIRIGNLSGDSRLEIQRFLRILLGCQLAR